MTSSPTIEYGPTSTLFPNSAFGLMIAVGWMATRDGLLQLFDRSEGGAAADLFTARYYIAVNKCRGDPGFSDQLSINVSFAAKFYVTGPQFEHSQFESQLIARHYRP